jgi:hypothetical protein
VREKLAAENHKKPLENLRGFGLTRHSTRRKNLLVGVISRTTRRFTANSIADSVNRLRSFWATGGRESTAPVVVEGTIIVKRRSHPQEG